jgi:hypothetical protein
MSALNNAISELLSKTDASNVSLRTMQATLLDTRDENKQAIEQVAMRVESGRRIPDHVKEQAMKAVSPEAAGHAASPDAGTSPATRTPPSPDKGRSR